MLETPRCEVNNGPVNLSCPQSHAIFAGYPHSWDQSAVTLRKPSCIAQTQTFKARVRTQIVRGQNEMMYDHKSALSLHNGVFSYCQYYYTIQTTLFIT